MGISLPSLEKMSKLLLLFLLLSPLVFTQPQNRPLLLSKETIASKRCSPSIFHSLFSDPSLYNISTHHTTTEDGYILTLFNIQLKSITKFNQYPFFYMHGMGSSADDLFLNGEDASIGFFLLNKGFDVWAGNFRGNKYSHIHINKNITEEKFFDFSWQEMAEYDIPAMYKYI